MGKGKKKKVTPNKTATTVRISRRSRSASWYSTAAARVWPLLAVTIALALLYVLFLSPSSIGPEEDGILPRRPRSDDANGYRTRGSRPSPDHSWLRTAQNLGERWSDKEGTTQVIRDFPTVLALHATDDYMTNIVHADPFYEPVRDSCDLKFEYCAEMASSGLCPPHGKLHAHSMGMSLDGAGAFMEKSCAPACRLCHLKSYQTRCPFDIEAAKASDVFKGSGDLHAMFQRMISSEEHRQYGPINILSMPGGRAEPTPITDGPWLVAFDNFLTEEECTVLRARGASTGEGWTRSKTGIVPNNSSAARTSQTNWCMLECHADPAVQQINRRIEAVTGIPATNYEYLQILRYSEGEFYGMHSDYNPVEVGRPQGVRVLTVFLYLSNVEGGGGTSFPGLVSPEQKNETDRAFAVVPRMGRALIWPNVLDADPNKMDLRTQHGAQAVTKGIKYGANAWIHMRDFKTAFNKACH